MNTAIKARTFQTDIAGYLQPGQAQVFSKNPVCFKHECAFCLEEQWLAYKGSDDRLRIQMLHGIKKSEDGICQYELLLRLPHFWITKCTHMKVLTDVHYKIYYQCYLWNGQVLDYFVITKKGIDFSKSKIVQSREDVPMDCIRRIAWQDEVLQAYIELEGEQLEGEQ